MMILYPILAISLALFSCNAQEHLTCWQTYDSTSALLHGYVELEDGWIAAFNGYKYKANLDQQSWDDSRSVCQSWGGDLIVYGFQDPAVRTTLTRVFGTGWYWIGINDKDNEGVWRWINGLRTKSNDVTLWEPGFPSGGESQDCGISRFTNELMTIYHYGYFVRDDPCSLTRSSMCEKLI